MKIRWSSMALVSTVLASPIAAQKLPDIAPYLMTDRAAEIALARSSAPKSVSDAATVYVLTRTGFVEAEKGTNGFACVVLRSFSSSPNDPNYWNAKVRGPQCTNPAATRTVLPAILKDAEMVLSGVSPTEADARMKRGYASHEYPMPAPGAMAFMLSPNQYLLDNDPHWLPHLMFFYDKSQPASSFGVGGVSNTIIDGSAGDSNAPVLTLFIPVRRWADGTPAVSAAAH